MRTALLTLLALLLVAPASAQDAAPEAGLSPSEQLIVDARAQLTGAVNTGDQATMQRAEAAFVRATNADDSRVQAYAHYYAAKAMERRLVMFDREEQRDEIVDLIDAAVEHLEQAEDLMPDFAEAYALHSSLLGQKVGMKPMLGMILGPKVGRIMERGKAAGPDNPRVVMTEAQSLLFTPKMWGGSKERAMEGFRRAITLFEAEAASPPADPLAPVWGHDEAYAWLGLALSELERPDEARAAYEQALVINPSYGWVSRVLLPQVASSE
ncbi:MAG: tetratricopeptide repeat protein [Bacteroidota bacterium]